MFVFRFLQTNKLFLSRHVKFVENVIPLRDLKIQSNANSSAKEITIENEITSVVLSNNFRQVEQSQTGMVSSLIILSFTLTHSTSPSNQPTTLLNNTTHLETIMSHPKIEPNISTLMQPTPAQTSPIKPAQTLSSHPNMT